MNRLSIKSNLKLLWENFSLTSVTKTCTYTVKLIFKFYVLYDEILQSSLLGSITTT